MRNQWGRWKLVPGGDGLIHTKTGCIVIVAQVRTMHDIPGAMEAAGEYALHDKTDMIWLAAALLAVIGERKP